MSLKKQECDSKWPLVALRSRNVQISKRYFWTHFLKNSVRLIRQDATRIDRTEKTERTSTRTSLPSVLSVTSSKYDIIRRTNNPLQTRAVDEMNTSVQLPLNFR